MAGHSISTAPPIDLVAFRTAMRAGGIEEIVEPTLGLFVEESTRLLGSLEGALASGDSDTFRRAAHTLKGSSGNVRARNLSQLAERIESFAAHSDFEGARPLVVEARQEHASVVDFLVTMGIG